MRLGSPISASSGASIELTGYGKNRRVSLRGWNRYDGTLAHHWTIAEFAQALGLTVPERKLKSRGKNRI